MPCCKCNRTGSCKGCACVKAKRLCKNCLPSKLGSCANTTEQSQPTGTRSTSLDASPLDAHRPNRPPTSLTAPELEATSTDRDPLVNTQQDPRMELPPCSPTNEPVFTWGTHDANDFSTILEAAYTEVIHWRKNSFTIPFGNAGKEFVTELAKLYSAFASASALESIALKAATTLPILLLQKPQKASKAKEHIICLERRLRLWREGNLNDLVLEGRTIQRRLPKGSSSKSKESCARSFANLIFAGKCKAALNLLTKDSEGSILHLDDLVDPAMSDSPTVRATLLSKHPKGQGPHPNCTPPQEAHPVIFEAIDANTIRSAALHTTGAVWH